MNKIHRVSAVTLNNKVIIMISFGEIACVSVTELIICNSSGPNDFLYFIDMSPKFVIKEFPPQKNSDAGEIFQTVMLERHENHDTKDLCFKEIQTNTPDVECHWRDDKRLDTGFCAIHKKNLTDRRDEHGRRDLRQKHITNWLGVNFQSHLPELQEFGREKNVNQWNYTEQSIKNDSSVSLHQRNPSSVKTDTSHKYENDFIDSLLFTEELGMPISAKPCKSFDQDSHFTIHQLVHSGKKQFVCDICGKVFN